MDTTIASHIAHLPSALHGTKACIAGTGIRVEDIYNWHIVQGRSPQEIVASFPQLTMADVHAALAYYWDHREILHRQWEEGEKFVDEMMAKYPSGLADKMNEKGIDLDTFR